MSFNSRGEYMGHSHEDDEYEHSLRVGAFVRHYSNVYLGTGEVQERFTLCNDAVTWRVRWDAPDIPDAFYYSHELKVLG